MKKLKIQSFLQKNFFKKNILSKTFSKFLPFFNMPKGPWKISLNQLNKKSLEKQKTKSRELAENNFNMDKILNEMYLEIKKFEALKVNV